MTTAKDLIEQRILEAEVNPVKIANARGMTTDATRGKGGWVFHFPNSGAAKLAKKDLEAAGFKVSAVPTLHVK